MSKFVSKEDSENITKDFISSLDKNKQQQIEDLFSKMQQRDSVEQEENIKTNEDAIKKFTQLFKPKTFSLLIGDVTFFFKYNLSIFQYEQLKLIDPKDINEKLKFFHTLLVEPKIDFDLFKELPAEYITYAEQKIYDFFLNNLAKIKI